MSDTSTRREQLQAKIDRVHAARMNAEEFINAVGNLSSQEAGPIGMELIRASSELATEFGPQQPNVERS
jgi:hypothetical protein